MAIVTDPVPRSGTSKWDPDLIYVVSRHARELSWVFESLRDAFYAEKRLDYMSKYPFFGRLAHAANRCLENDPAASKQAVCSAVIREAFAIYQIQEEAT